MGMFDIVVPEIALPDEGAKAVKEWQTKTFDAPFMDRYRITADGQLQEEQYRVEDQSEFARTGSGDAFCGCMTRIHEDWTHLVFDGVLNFYGFEYPDGEWFEYDATFNSGQLVSIVRVMSERGAKE